MLGGYVPTQADLEAFWTFNATGYSISNQLGLLKTMRTFNSATPILPDDGEYFTERSDRILGKYSRGPERTRTLKDIQRSGDENNLQGICLANLQIEKSRDTIRFLEDAIAMARNAMAYRAIVTTSERNRTAEQVMVSFLGVSIPKLEAEVPGDVEPTWLK